MAEIAATSAEAEVEFQDANDEQIRADIEDFYRDHPELTLKTLICRAYSKTGKKYVALVLTGDKKVDFDVVTSQLGLQSIRLANPDEMRKLGLIAGFVSPIDCCHVEIVGDRSIERYASYYDGGNRVQVYRRNVNYPRDFKVSRMLNFSK
jgi:prolyl-tRNA synthetase